MGNTFLHLTSSRASAAGGGGGVGAGGGGRNEESCSISCILSLPTVRCLDRHVHMWYFPSYDRRAGRTDTSLARGNILFSGRQCKASINGAFQAA